MDTKKQPFLGNNSTPIKSPVIPTDVRTIVKGGVAPVNPFPCVPAIPVDNTPKKGV
jgi:hypothetical protein